MNEFSIWRGVQPSLTGTAGASALLDFTGLTGYVSTWKRSGVVIRNTGAGTLYVDVANATDAAPTVTAANALYQIAPGTSLSLSYARSVSLYIFGTSTYAAREHQ